MRFQDLKVWNFGFSWRNLETRDFETLKLTLWPLAAYG